VRIHVGADDGKVFDALLEQCDRDGIRFFSGRARGAPDQGRFKPAAPDVLRQNTEVGFFTEKKGVADGDRFQQKVHIRRVPF
jgi:hypothetical protein